MSDCIKLLEKERAFSSGKTHWALSSTLFADLSQKAGSSIRDLLTKRIISHRDSIIPKGFSGSAHSLLLKEELEKEIDWGLSNPWSSGVKDLFDIYPDAWIPADIDLLRSPLKFFYDSYPYIWIILPGAESGEPGVKCVYKTDVLVFPSLFLNGMEDFPLLKKIKKNASRLQRPMFIYFYLEGPESLPSLEQFFNVAERLYSSKWIISFDCLDTHLLQRQEKGSRDDTEAVSKEVIPHSPLHRLVRMDGFRNHMPLTEPAQDEKTASFLHDFGNACSNRSPDIPKTFDTPFSIKERSLFANMPGLATISEKNQAIQFDNGRLKEICFLQTPITCGIPVTSYISTKEETWYFQSTSAFSFEDEGVRGLRESLIVEASGKDFFPKETGYLITDYYFQEGVQDLVIAVHIRYPEFNGNGTLSAFAPLEIPVFLFDRSEKIIVQGWYPDGESYSVDISSAETIYEFPGSAFCISSGKLHLALNFACGSTIPVTLLPCRVTSRKKLSLFSINPMGSYRPCRSDYVGGFGEYFSFLLKGIEGAIPLVDVSSQPGKELVDQPWIQKQKQP